MAQESFLDPPMPDVLDQWRYYLKQLQLKPGQQVLDVGCHSGDTAVLVQQLYPYVGKITGIDKSEDHIVKARARLEEIRTPVRLEFMIGDARDLPFADGTFDRIICADTLEWVGDPPRAVAELRRVLSPRGLAVVIHTDFDSQIFSTRDLSLTRRIVHEFTDSGQDGTIGRKLGGLCRSAGFSSVDTKVYTLVNETFEENLYGYRVAHMMVDWLTRKERLTRDGAAAWLADLATLDRSDRFFYSVNRTICICRP